MKLVPVIYIAYGNPETDPPSLYPVAKHSATWEEYRVLIHRKAGFEMPMTPIREGLFLFRFDAISEFNLEKLVRDRLNLAAEGDEDPIPMFGGYVLEEVGRILLAPQCCGDLSDIRFWKFLSQGSELFWEGHPQPEIILENGRAFFCCIDKWEQFSEPFVERFDISLADLAEAVQEAEDELRAFETRLEILLQRLALPPFADQLTFNRGGSPHS
ncbi:hypothetical protein [Rubinisphaera margarita]|uniref:hypothetical protein n=1 Tax=Rubinisphaera margarita TaxID=2909586 RepID=UPI001EE89686|nr:hypothetical protein [Rubinisphaera margarita]MCG6157506.1 hypothetical protein [Rubinisphaera margarita]